ncbi:MAG: hypothetical protein HFJ09_08485 [Lachnospiraceae bacterium]|nr:hypothetical protein [Lachnospiraceae bacterium]
MDEVTKRRIERLERQELQKEIARKIMELLEEKKLTISESKDILGMVSRELEKNCNNLTVAQLRSDHNFDCF